MASSAPKRLTPPPPPASLARIRLETRTPPATECYRLTHEQHSSPLYFSRKGFFRFDSPAAKWGVCYLANCVETAFLEVFADGIRKGTLSYADLHARVVWKVEVPPNLELLALEGPTLPRIKATVQSFVSRYSVSQEWGRALMVHPADLDGLIYRGRQSAGACLALFGDSNPVIGRRYQPALHAVRLGRITEWSRFYSFLDRSGARVVGLPTNTPKSPW